MRRALAAALWLLLLPPLSGCGLVTLMYDQMIGPLGPVPGGAVHDAAVGTDFQASLEGVTGDAEGEAIYRPLPRDILRRMASPSSFHAALIGIEALILGASTFAYRGTENGTAPEAEEVPGLGAPLEEVLAAIGPPDWWVRYAGGEALAYRGERERWMTLNAGVPPVVGFFIPGAGNLAFRWIGKKERSDGFVLFFDADRHLARVGIPAPPP